MASYHSLPNEIKNLIHLPLTISRLINKEILKIKEPEFITRMNYISLQRRSDYLHNAKHMVCTSNMDFGCSLYNQGQFIIRSSGFNEVGNYNFISENHTVCDIDYMLHRIKMGLFLIREDVEIDLLSTYNILEERKYNIAKNTILKMLNSKISLKYAIKNRQEYHSWLYFNAMIIGLKQLNVKVRTIYVDNYVTECAQLHHELVNYFKNL